MQLYLNPQAEHLRDRFPVAMRLTVMSQMAKGEGFMVYSYKSAEAEERRTRWGHTLIRTKETPA